MSAVPAPRGGGSPGLVSDAIKGIKHGHVGWQGLLCNHVSHKHHKVVVWQAICPLPQFPHL